MVADSVRAHASNDCYRSAGSRTLVFFSHQCSATSGPIAIIRSMSPNGISDHAECTNCSIVLYLINLNSLKASAKVHFFFEICKRKIIFPQNSSISCLFQTSLEKEKEKEKKQKRGVWLTRGWHTQRPQSSISAGEIGSFDSFPRGYDEFLR